MAAFLIVGAACSDTGSHAASLIELGVDDGASNGTAVHKTLAVGAEASIELSTGAKVRIPEGSTDKELTLLLKRPRDDEALGLVKTMKSGDKLASAPYVLTPHGSKFNKDVEVTLPIAKGRNVDKLKVAWLEDEDDTSWELIGAPEVDGDRATIKVKHFSVFALVESSGGSVGTGDSQQDSGTTSQQDSGTTSQQDSGAASQQDSGTTSQQDSGTTSQQDSGTTSQQDSGDAAPSNCAAGMAGAPCVACVAGTYDHDHNAETACVAVSASCQAGQFQSQAPSATQDRICTSCMAGEYCAGGSAARKTCSGGTWDHDQNAATSCTVYKDCKLDEYVASQGTKTEDRNCQSCPVGYAAWERNAPSCEVWSGGPKFSQVSAGASATCAIRADNGKLVCWGNSGGGGIFTAGAAPLDVAFKSIELAAAHGCGVRASDGRVQCWGSIASQGEQFLQATPADVVLSSVTISGGYQACGLRADDSKAQCWSAPIAPSGVIDEPDVAFKSISLGDAGSGGNGGQACGVRASDNTLLCWGAEYGAILSSAPSGVAFSSVELGPTAACGLRVDDGHLDCWWGLGSAQPVSVAVLGRAYTQVALGQDSGCALRADNQEAVCWGSGPLADFAPPQGVAFSQLSIGWAGNDDDHACGVRVFDGQVQCWGSNSSGKARGGYDSRAYTAVSTTYVGACAIRASDESLECWDRDQAGARWPLPSGAFVSVSGSRYAGCAVHANDGTLACWGNPNSANTSPPPTGTGFVQVSVRSETACALHADGHVTCWGGYGAVLTDAPMAIPFVSVELGAGYACGLRADNATAHCWGDDASGRVSGAPGGVAFDSLSVGYDGSCGIRSDTGRVECWGANDDGLVSQAPTTTAFAALAVDRVGCGVRADNGQLECWGEPRNGWSVTRAPAGIAFDAISQSGTGALGCGLLTSTGRMVCWGLYTYNPLLQVP
jgi:hypothetical protein